MSGMMTDVRNFDGAARENDVDTSTSFVRIQEDENLSVSSEDEESITDIEENPHTQSAGADAERPANEDEEATDEREDDADSLSPSLGVRIQVDGGPSILSEDEESVADVDEVPAADEESPASEEATDTIDNEGESPIAAGDGQISVFGHSQATADLPVAYEVESRAPEPSLVRLIQQADPTIPHAIPEEQIIQEERKVARRIVLFVSGLVLSLIVVVVVIFVLTFGRESSSDASSGGGDETIKPTPSPTTAAFHELREIVISVSFDNGTSLKDSDLLQYKALKWLEGNANLDDYDDWKRIQRYALATFYYAANGDSWFIKDGWLSDDDECTWYSQAQDVTTETRNPPADENGTFAVLRLEKINMYGTLPVELALLSDSLYRLDLELNLLNGTIPTELGLLATLERLDLDTNRLTGTIPTELAMIGGKNVPKSEIHVRVEHNLLTGTIPTEILGIEGLELLGLAGNLLTGSIPTESDWACVELDCSWTIRK